MKEENKKESEKSLEKIKEDISTIPGGAWAIILGAILALFIAIMSFVNTFLGLFGIIIITAMAYLSSKGRIGPPEVVTVISSSFIFTPIFILVMLFFQVLIWGITAIILLFL